MAARWSPTGQPSVLRVTPEQAADAVFTEAGSSTGVELLTFHAAKGREWHTVVVTGVETGLVPHRSATTVDAKAEEARLLHVAMNCSFLGEVIATKRMSGRHAAMSAATAASSAGEKYP